MHLERSVSLNRDFCTICTGKYKMASLKKAGSGKQHKPSKVANMDVQDDTLPKSEMAAIRRMARANPVSSSFDSIRIVFVKNDSIMPVAFKAKNAAESRNYPSLVAVLWTSILYLYSFVYIYTVLGYTAI